MSNLRVILRDQSLVACALDISSDLKRAGYFVYVSVATVCMGELKVLNYTPQIQNQIY